MSVITYPAGAALTSAARFTTGFLGIFGASSIFILPAIGIPITVLILTLILAKAGNQVDVSNRKTRGYYSFLGLYLGSWKPIDGYESIAVIRQNLSQTSHSRAGNSTTIAYTVYTAVLLDKRHLKKLPVGYFKDKGIAFAEVKNLAILLDIKHVKIARKASSKRRR